MSLSREVNGDTWASKVKGQSNKEGMGPKGEQVQPRVRQRTATFRWRARLRRFVTSPRPLSSFGVGSREKEGRKIIGSHEYRPLQLDVSLMDTFFDSGYGELGGRGWPLSDSKHFPLRAQRHHPADCWFLGQAQEHCLFMVKPFSGPTQKWQGWCPGAYPLPPPPQPPDEISKSRVLNRAN